MIGKSNDWMPSGRVQKLKMANDWTKVFIDLKDVLKIPEETRDKFVVKINECATWLKTPEGEHTAIRNTKTKDAFDELTAMMRDIKRRYFLSPPLVNGDYVALGLKPKDETPTHIAAPVLPAEAELLFPAKATVEVTNIKHVPGHDDPRAEYGVRIHYGILGEPTERDKFRIAHRPKTGEDLPHSVFTRRKSHRFNFAEDSGCEVFFCLRFENSKGDAGPWGNVISAFIP